MKEKNASPVLFLTDFRLFGTLGYDAGSLEIERNGAFF